MPRTLCLLLMALTAMPARAQAPNPWAGARQALVVTTPAWDATGARVQRWARSRPGAAWRRVGAPMSAMVGRGGLGWGLGLHPAQAEGPQKREGDGRAPAGVYRLAAAFGYAPAAEVPWIRMPYLPARAVSACVDDGASRWYNRWVERDRVTVDWSSHEDMRRADELYRLGVWVEHNGASTPGAGSCIFIHQWRGPGVATVGCTAFAAAELDALLGWLDPHAQPVLVQLPDAEYARLRAEWRLP